MFVVLSMIVVCSVAGAETFRFTASADNRPYDSGNLSRWEWLLDEMDRLFLNDEGVFHIMPGDIDHPEVTDASLKTQFGPDVIWYPVVGNHEAETADDMTWIRSAFSTLPYVVNGGPEGCETTTYSFDYGNAHFVAINEYYDGASDTGTDGDVVDALYNWLADDLAANTKPVVFVIGHEPAYPEYAHTGDSLNKYPANRDRFWKLLNDEQVIAYLCGHTHWYYAKQVGGVDWEPFTWQIDCGNAGNPRELEQTFVDVCVTDTDVTFTVWQGTEDVAYGIRASWTVNIPAPTASLLVPLDGGPDDLDGDAGDVTVNTTQSSFQIQLSDVGDGIDDETVISATVTLTKDTETLTEGTGSDYSFSYDAGLDVITLTPAGGEFGNGFYVIMLNGGAAKIMDVAGNEMAATTLTIEIDTSIVPPVTLSFQQGVGGYSAMVDTMIRWADPATNFADSATQYDGSYQYQYNADMDSSGGLSHVLLRFDDIIGGSAAQIPPGSTIVSVTLRIRSTDDGNGGNAHAMLQPWIDTVITWNNSFGGDGIQANDSEALIVEDDGVPSNSPDSDVDLDVTGTLQDWADGVANNGWAILPNGTNGWHMAAAEHPTPDYRPELIVTFTTMGNRPPVADAGPDQTVTDSDENGFETVTLDGSDSSDPDGEITTYEWKEGANVLGDTVSITMEFTVGTHTVTLTVTDDEGATDSDDVVITVAPPEPVTLFSDGFESGNFTAGGWTTSGDTKIEGNSAKVYTGSYAAKIKKVAWIEKTVSTVGYADIHVKYARKTKGFDAKQEEFLFAEWSVDGSVWHTLEATQDGSWAVPDMVCDPGADNNPDFRVRFRTNTDKEEAYIDDVEIAGTPAGPVDNPALVGIVNPGDGATAAGVVPIQIDATDDEDAAGTLTVEWNIDGGAWQPTTYNGVSGLYEASWNSTSASEGGHTVNARATDSGSNTTAASAEVTVDNVDDAPTVSITNPTDGATVSGSVTVSADAADDKGVSQVEFFVDGASIGVDSVGSDGWWVDWDTSGVADDPHTVSATATDTALQTASDSISVTVNNSGPSTVHVESIDMSLEQAGKNWKGVAGVQISVYQANATVVGDWSLNGKTIQTGASGITDGSGYTVITSAPKKAKSGQKFTFTVMDVVLGGYNYDSGQGVKENWITVP